jgi:hypothetical protein
MADTPNVFVNWDVLEAAIAAAFPNHRIVRGMLLEDFNNTPAGLAYYDLITIFDLTLGTRGKRRPSAVTTKTATPTTESR